MTINMTELDTCDYLPIYIAGGQKPYTVTFTPVSIETAINITLGSNDTLEMVNTFSPDTKVMVAASDRFLERGL